MSTGEKRTAFRLPLPVRALLELAAAAEDESLTRFACTAIIQRAHKTLGEDGREKLFQDAIKAINEQAHRDALAFAQRLRRLAPADWNGQP